jgi:site-specific DNA-methyltransferase (adenine-specific)
MRNNGVSNQFKTIISVVAGDAQWALLCGDAYKIVSDLVYRFDGGEIGRIFDHTLTDPGYDTRTHAGARGSKGSDLGIDFEPTDPGTYLSDVLKLTRRWSLVFCALEMLGTFQAFAGTAYRKGGIWVKPDSAPQFNGMGPAQGAEGIAIMHYFKRDRKHQDKLRWNNGGNRAVWTHNVAREDRFVPTQKPVPLAVELIENFTDPGDIIFDMFAGSAAIGVAALETGRRYIGIEAKKRIFTISGLRLRAYDPSLSSDASAMARAEFHRAKDEYVAQQKKKKSQKR